jgi:hypothetical protein
MIAEDFNANRSHADYDMNSAFNPAQPGQCAANILFLIVSQ